LISFSNCLFLCSQDRLCFESQFETCSDPDPELTAEFLQWRSRAIAAQQEAHTLAVQQQHRAAELAERSQQLEQKRRQLPQMKIEAQDKQLKTAVLHMFMADMKDKK
jgi:hypothetical protein